MINAFYADWWKTPELHRGDRDLLEYCTMVSAMLGPRSTCSGEEGGGAAKIFQGAANENVFKYPS